MEPVETTPISHVARAERALALAGRALDPNGSSDAQGDALLSAQLLSRALESAAASITKAASENLTEAMRALDDNVLKKTAGGRTSAMDLCETIEQAAAGKATARQLASAEAFAQKLVSYARDEKRFSKQSRIRKIVTIVGLVLVAAAAIDGLHFVFGHRYRFRASSAYEQHPLVGELPAITSYDVFFHTAQEHNPYLEIDLGEERTVSSVNVVNRFDCCTDRAIPLVITLRTADGSPHEVARRTSDFDSWRAKFPAEKARFVRLTVPRETILHLRNVEVQ